MSDDNRLLIDLVRSSERIDQSLKDVKHDIANITQMMDRFVPRKEIEKDHEGFNKRLDKLENKWVKWFGPIVGAIGSFLVGLALYLLKWFGGGS